DLEMREKSNFIPENSEANEGYRCPTQDPDLEVNTTHVISSVLRSMFVPTFGTETKVGPNILMKPGLTHSCRSSKPLGLLCVKAFADARDTTGYTQRPVSEHSFEGYRKLPGDKKEGIKDPRI
ncbi:hypothetical protein E2I00_004969, partial [Balaenoptera physalus]